METKTIDQLEVATAISDGDLLVAQQSGVAVKLTIGQLKEYAIGSISSALDTINGEVV